MTDDRLNTISGPVPGEPPVPGGLIPLWLAVLVLVLLLAVMGVGGYVIRGLVAGDRPALSPQEAEVEKWREQVRESPQNTASHLGLGYAYQNAGRYDKALEQYVSKKQYRSAIKAVEPAAEANPEMSDLQYLMGLALEKLGVTDSAVKRYRLALKYTPDMQQAIEGLKRLGVTP